MPKIYSYIKYAQKFISNTHISEHTYTRFDVLVHLMDVHKAYSDVRRLGPRTARIGQCPWVFPVGGR